MRGEDYLNTGGKINIYNTNPTKIIKVQLK